MHDWVIPYLKQYKGRVAFALLLSFFGIASAAMLLFVSGYLISKSALRPENILLVYVPIVSVRAFSIGQAALPYLEKLISHDIVLRILAKYRRRLYMMLEPQAVFLEERYKTGDLLNVLSDDIEKLQDFYIRTFLPSLSGLLIYAVISIVFGFFDLPFMLLMLALLGIIVFLAPFMSYRLLKKRHLLIKQKRQSLYQQITDAMFGQLDWLVSGRVQEALEKAALDNEALLSEEASVDKWRHLRDALLRLVSGCAILAVMYWAYIQTNDGAISATLIAAFVLMMFSVADALLPISPAVEEIPVYTDAIERMQQLERVKASSTEKATPAPELESEPVLAIRNITYSYANKQKHVLKQFSMTLEPGMKVAILGKSGTGKSTLLKMISGMLKPDEGEILIGNSPTNKAYLGEIVSVLNQKPHLFHTTIVNNVRIGRPDASNEDIINVLEKVQIMEMIRQLPTGIHTQMDEMGKRFSGGERQRIAFARVLLQRTPIILLDEPTTGLDPHTENSILRMMLEAAHDRTMIWVTHHLAGAELMDRIIFMDNGRIKMQGTHNELLEREAYYRKLYEMDRGIFQPLK